jgi:hypothetical protein
MRPSLLCAAALVLTMSGPAAQVPVIVQPRDGQPAGAPPIAGTASIGGSVTVAGSGDPARRARITVTGSITSPGGERRFSRNTTTDEHGRFFIPALPAGRYTLSVSKPGHVTISYGQRQPGSGRPGTPIQLGDDERFEAHLQIPRGGVLTGTVLDEMGEATPGTSVRALRYVIQNGQRTLQQGGTGTTDDRGIFRIHGLQPGDYVVCAMPRPNVSVATTLMEMQVEVASARQALAQTSPDQARAMEERLQSIEAQLAAQPPELEQRTAYASVCYPGTTLPASAVSIPLGAGQERAGVDFQLQLVPVGTVEGVVISPAGVSAQTVQISLTPSGPGVPGMGASSARASADGRFRLNNVAPGQYRLTARGTMPVAGTARGGGPPAPRPAAPRLWAAADISMDGQDLSDVALALHPALSLSGQLAFDGGTPPADLTRIRVTLSPAPGPDGPVPGASSSTATADASGRFTVTNLVPGYYRISVAGVQGWWPESAVIGSRDALDAPVEVRPGADLGGTVITMIDQQTEIAGVLSDSRGAPVADYTLIVFPADSQFWTPGTRRIQSTRPATDGRFAFRNLPAGDYRVATVLDPEPGSWTDPGYLSELEHVSLRVSLRRGEQKTQNIRLAQ